VQGFGRLIRTEDDYGVVILYDRGIHRKSYKPGLRMASERNWRFSTDPWLLHGPN